MPPTFWRVPAALIAVTCFSPALAACQKGAKSLKFAGVGVIQASSIEEEGEDSKVLRDACFDFSGWTFKSTELRADSTGFQADATSLTALGGQGSVEGLSFTIDDNSLNVENLRFEFGSTFKLEGFPYAGQYVMQAESGSLTDFRFDLENVIFDETVTLGPISTPWRRIKAKRALLADNNATLVDAQLAYLVFTIRGALAVQGNNQLGVTRSDVVIGRNRDADELGFSADRFTLDEENIVHLENATFRAFGTNLFTLPEFEYDPLEPLPVVLGYGPGVTAGVSNLRIGPKRDGIRVTLIGHNVLDASGNVQFGVTWTQPAYRLSISQAKNTTSTLTSTVLGSFSGTNTTGWIYNFNFDLGRNLLALDKPTGARAYQIARIGAAFEQPISFSISGISNTFKLRESLEIGEVAQEELQDIPAKRNPKQPHTMGQLVGFATGNLEFSYTGSALGIGWNAKAGINAYEFTPGTNYRPDPTFTSRFAFDAGISYNIPGVFSSSLTFLHRQPLVNTYAEAISTDKAPTAASTGFIRRLSPEDYTFLNFSTRLTTSTFLGIPPAGYAGLTLENPSAAIIINSNLRNISKANNKGFTIDKVLTVQKIELAFDIGVYDGQTFIDTLDRPAAAPILTISPFVKYDFAFTPGYQLGQYGLNFTVYSASLGLTLGTTYERRSKQGGTYTDSWSLNLGFRLR
jgi:hypothetical protein